VSDAPDLEGLGGNLSPSQSALSTMVGMIFPFKLPRRLITQGWVEIMLVVAAPHISLCMADLPGCQPLFTPLPTQSGQSRLAYLCAILNFEIHVWTWLTCPTCCPILRQCFHVCVADACNGRGYNREGAHRWTNGWLVFPPLLNVWPCRCFLVAPDGWCGLTADPPRVAASAFPLCTESSETLPP
jgi:hypothetical protein